MRSLILAAMIIFGCLSSSFAQTATRQQSPDPEVHFGNITGKAASVDELMARPELVITVPAQPDRSASFRVTSFAVSALHDGIYEELPVRAPNVPTQDTVIIEDPVTGQVTMRITNEANKKPGNKVDGSRLTQYQAGRISTLKPGDKVFVDDIKVIVPDGTTRSFGSLELLVR